MDYEEDLYGNIFKDSKNLPSSTTPENPDFDEYLNDPADDTLVSIVVGVIRNVPVTRYNESADDDRNEVSFEDLKPLMMPGKPATAFDIDIEGLTEKPWRRPNVDISDYFNFNFTERVWRDYSEKQLRYRMDSVQSNQTSKPVPPPAVVQPTFMARPMPPLMPVMLPPLPPPVVMPPPPSQPPEPDFEDFSPRSRSRERSSGKKQKKKNDDDDDKRRKRRHKERSRSRRR